MLLSTIVHESHIYLKAKCLVILIIKPLTWENVPYFTKNCFILWLPEVVCYQEGEGWGDPQNQVNGQIHFLQFPLMYSGFLLTLSLDPTGLKHILNNKTSWESPVTNDAEIQAKPTGGRASSMMDTMNVDWKLPWSQGCGIFRAPAVSRQLLTSNEWNLSRSSCSPGTVLSSVPRAGQMPFRPHMLSAHQQWNFSSPLSTYRPQG